MLFSITFTLLSQTRTITGKVTFASDNESVPGANVIIKGTTTGTITDIDGNFSLQASPDDIIEVSFMGYIPQTAQVGENNNFSFALVEDVASIDEVVVIGYGVQAKKLVTGSTVNVKGDDLQKRNSTNALQALQGLAPGINITSKSGQPGEGLRVTIRGAGTTGDPTPLFIVDGVPTGDIKYLSSADIESIDILRDAASAAIYGVRGANGVVLITTKKGKAGKSQITFDAYYGVQNAAKKVELLDARQYAMIMNEQHLNSGGTTGGLPFNVNDLPAYVRGGVTDNNWLDKMIVKNASTQNYTIGASGGSDQGIYSFSLSYSGQEGIVGGAAKSNYERYNGRFNSEKNIMNGKLKVGENFVYSYITKNGIQVGNQYDNTLRSAFNASPLIPDYDDAGNYFNTDNDTIFDQFGESYWNPTEANPYINMELNNQNITVTQKILGNVYAEMEIIKNLKFRSSFGIDNKAEEYRSFTPIYHISLYSFNSKTKMRQKMAKDFKYVADNILTYDIFKGAHTINAMIGTAAENYTGVWLQADNTELVFNDLEHAYVDNSTNTLYPEYKMEGKPNDNTKLLSYFGRVQYNYNETYLFNATFRADGSSKFAEGHRWGYFPSVSAGWVLSNESFLQATSAFMNFLKIRASWGQNGSESASAFNYIAPIAFTQATYAFGETEGESTPGSYPKTLSNEDLGWEISEQTDIGFDARFFNNISVGFDWYRKNTKFLLIKPPVLATAGAEAPYINGGKVLNTGIELNVTYNKTQGDFTYNISANGAYNKNKLLEIDTDDGIIHGADNTLYANSPEFYRAEVGHPIGYFWGYEMDGLFQYSTDVTSHTNSTGTIIQPNAKPGDVRYVDQNDDGRLDDDDKIELGDPNPDFVFGLAIACDYKGFDFSIVSNGVAGNQIVQSYRNHTDKYSNYTTAILDRWKGPGTSDEIPRVTNSNINYKNFSSLFIQNGSYLRISDVTLGYDLARGLKIQKISQLRFYASVQNLYTLTKYNGMDPEVGYGFDNGDTDKFSSGIDLGFYPRPRTILFGINLKF
ncbi:MAG: TonB-dependent receptor [Bacteroidales bacterium]|nr:TonB-dependent receptor [Bacteroidales bacterium]